MKNWLPRIPGGSAPVYERLSEALERDVREGRLAPGDRLPPHRDLAHRLSLSVGTVSRAYVEAERRGLIQSHVGRGSYVTGSGVPAATEAGPVNMAHNAPPAAPAQRWIAHTLLRIRQRHDLAESMGYAPPEGLPSIRRAGAEWLRRHHGLADASNARIIQCNGGQHGLALAFAAVARADEAILCDATAYPGLRTIADHGGYRLTGVAMDDRGMEPEALARAASQSNARAVVVLPTLQNPTTITLDELRRREIVAVARAYDLTIIEDEAYRLFANGYAPSGFTELAPERTLLIASLSKSVAAGLRLGFILPPENESIRDRILLGVRATGYSPPSLGGLIFSQWEQDGTADRIADDVLAEAQARTDMAREILGRAVAAPGAMRSLHLWMPMPIMDAERLTAQALREGIALTPPDGPVIDRSGPSGIRICLGGVANRFLLETSLRRVSDVLRPGNSRSAIGLM